MSKDAQPLRNLARIGRRLLDRIGAAGRERPQAKDLAKVVEETERLADEREAGSKRKPRRTG